MKSQNSFNLYFKDFIFRYSSKFFAEYSLAHFIPRMALIELGALMFLYAHVLESRTLEPLQVVELVGGNGA